MTDTLKIEQYDFVSFCQDMYNAFKQGYEPVWTSDDSPQQIGFCFHAILHKAAPTVVGELVLEASIDTAKLQEQLKTGGEVEQMLADSLFVEEIPLATVASLDVIANIPTCHITEDELHGNIPVDSKPTIDEALPKDEQTAPIKRTTRGRK